MAINRKNIVRSFTSIFASVICFSSYALAADNLQPILDCITYDSSADEVTAYFSYNNTSGAAIDIAVSATDNMFQPVPLDRGQVTKFEAGLHRKAFSVTFDVATEPTITWDLSGTTVVVSNDEALYCGEIGATGPAGPAGATGAQGGKGDKGDTGDKGDQGDLGPQGSKGDKGDIGSQGIQGPKGDTGADGIACWDLNANGQADLPSEDINNDNVVDTLDCKGPQGEKGDTGEQGKQGEQGASGEDGASAQTDFSDLVKKCRAISGRGTKKRPRYAVAQCADDEVVVSGGGFCPGRGWLRLSVPLNSNAWQIRCSTHSTARAQVHALCCR